MSHFNAIERAEIIMEREKDGKKITTIAARHQCSTTAVRKILSRYYHIGEITGGKPSGRPYSLSDVEKKKLDRKIKKKPTATAATLVNEMLESTGKRVSARTIQRYRRELGYRPYHQQIKKSLTSIQEETKSNFAKAYVNDDIKRWLFADEKIFTMNDTGTIAWYKPGDPRPTYTHS